MEGRVRIAMEAHGRGRVFVDDNEIKHITAISFESRAGDLNIVTIELRSSNVEIEGVGLLKEVEPL